MSLTDGVGAGGGGGGAYSHADFSSRWGCGRRIVACCDSVAEQCGEAEVDAAAGGCSRSTRARRSARTGWPPPRRSNCRFAARSRRATSSRPPSPARRRTATASPSSGHFPPLLRRRLARPVFQTHPPAAAAAALQFCSTRRASPWSSRSAPRSCAGGGGGCQGRSSFRIPERFPKCASTGNWQVPSAPAGSKRSWDPLGVEFTESLFSEGGREENGERARQIKQRCTQGNREMLPRWFTWYPRSASCLETGSVFSSGLPNSTPHVSQPIWRTQQHGSVCTHVRGI